MTEKYEQRAKIFQQAMQTCHSNNPTDCIEWFADKIIELEAQIEKMKNKNKESDAVLAAGSTFNKALNSMNKALEEERDKYRNMVFDKDDQLTKAKEIIKKYMRFKPVVGGVQYYHEEYEQTEKEAEQFLKDSEVEK